MDPAVATALSLPRLRAAGLKHGFTTRAHGDFSARALAGADGRERLKALGREVGFDPELLITAEQVHGETVVVAHLCENCGPGRRLPHTDGMITEEPWPLLITVADCFPAILFSPRERMVALVHCGWRGTTAGILPRALNRLIRETGGRRSEVLAGIGPGICADCYEVGDEVVQAAHHAGLSNRVVGMGAAATAAFDIAGAMSDQLLAAGVQPDNIEAIDRCTFEDAGLFSYRRDHTAARAAAVVTL